MKIAKREGLARKASKETADKASKHSQRGAYKGFLVATAAELEAWTRQAGDDAAIAFWAKAAGVEVARQVAKLCDVPAAGVDRKADPSIAAERDALAGRLAAIDREDRQTKRAAAQGEAWSRLEAVTAERDELRALRASEVRDVTHEQREYNKMTAREIKELTAENARLRAMLETAAPWEPEPATWSEAECPFASAVMQ